ncbi:hypothetical protein Tco_0774580 [Tanacetum coccineum]|uniref:Uncharacterized protein n=1 Tax=Tanacetum coccineum TaxID=301880 RepID=A0ABQ4ZP02_9ASTR
MLTAFEVQSNQPQRLRNAKTQSGESESETEAKMPYQSQLDRQTLTIAMRFLRSKTPEQRAAVDLDTHYTQEYLAECVGTETRRAVIYQGICHSKPYALRGVPFDETDAEASLHRSYYEVLEYLLRGRRSHARNKDVRTELDYYSEEYNEEREMEPRPVRVREATHVLRTRSPRARRHRGRVVEFEEAPNRDGSRVERESKGKRPLE